MINKCFVRLLTTLVVVMILGSLSPTTANAAYPVLKLDISNRNVASQTEPGFTSFTLADSGSEVEGITIELAGNLDARWRGTPTGISYELIYRDFIFSRPGGMTVTLSGLEANQTYEITIYAFDTGSAGDRIADWTTNGEFVLTTTFNGGISPTNQDDRAFTGTAQSDGTGTIVLECGPNENTVEQSGAGSPFGFMNALVVSSMTPLTKARRPEPAEGVLLSGTEASLGWLPGGYAASHNVFFGDNFVNVDSATTDDTDIFIGTTTDSIFLVGSAGSPYPEGLSPGTTYYWRIDEVNDLHPDSPWKGDVWSFTIPSKTAFNPIPVDGIMFVDPNITLSWIPGADSVTHSLYFGDNLQDVQAGTGGTAKGPVNTASYNPGLLELEKTYYWRIDEFDGSQTHTGNVWSFTTTLEGLGTVVLDMWEGVAGSTLDLLLDNQSYPDDPTWSDELTEFTTDDSIGDNYGARIHGWLYAPLTGDYTFLFSSADQGELWLSTDDDATNVQLLASELVWGSYDTFSRRSEPISLIGGNKYYIMALWKEGTDWDHCQAAWRGAGIREQEIIQGSYLSPYKPISAFGPVPKDGSIDAEQISVFSWRPGTQASSHDLYFGTNQEAVLNANTNSPEYMGTMELGSESFDPGKLELDTSYYWRIDEVNNLNPDSPWTGKAWSFTTGNFLVVDDFEDYNDYPPDEIYSTWIDGYGIEANGALVGYDLDQADFMAGEHIVETVIIHGGSQSMPFFYDNNMKYSETERAISGPESDWTREGVKELSLWFRGYPGYLGSFVERALGTYTMTASGADITGQSDEFHFAYKMLTGTGSIIARVLSIDDTDPWAKAGVMIRETLEPGSKHALACVTPGSGVASEGRPTTGGASYSTNQGGITAPHWVKLERDVSGNFTAFHSTDGSTWVQVGDAAPQNIQMSASVYIGLAVTSHNTDATCEAQFSNVSITGNVSQQEWMNQDIGITSNDPERMYVALNGSAVVYHENTEASLLDEWTEWRIDMSAPGGFVDQGVDLTNVNSISIGIGTQGETTTPGGLGTMYFDDIRLYRPEP